MRDVYPIQPISLRDYDAASIVLDDDYQFEEIAPGAYTKQAQFSVQFAAQFNENDHNDGLYNPRVFSENLAYQDGLTWQYVLEATPIAKATTAIAGGGPIPRTFQNTQNIDKTLYFNSATKELGFIEFQLQTTSGAIEWSTLEADAMNPRLCVMWERRDRFGLTADNPFGNTQNLWTFASVDIFVNAKNASGVLSRHLIGFCADGDFKVNDYKETVSFEKGKPSATAVTFDSKIIAMIEGTVASTDMWCVSKAMNIPAVIQNNKIVFTETNIQRPRENFNFSCEWQLSSGHYVQFIIPKGEIFFKEGFNPGGDEVTKYPFEIKPKVTGTGVVCRLEVTQYPVQLAYFPFGYSVLA